MLVATMFEAVDSLVMIIVISISLGGSSDASHGLLVDNTAVTTSANRKLNRSLKHSAVVATNGLFSSVTYDLTNPNPPPLDIA